VRKSAIFKNGRVIQIKFKVTFKIAAQVAVLAKIQNNGSIKIKNNNKF